MPAALLLAAALAAAPPPVWDYVVDAGADGRTLSVTATLRAGDGDLVVDDGMARFVRHPEARAAGGGWKALAARHDGFAACAPLPCEVRYEVALGEAASTLADRNVAFAQDGAIVAPPSSWLLHPEDAPAGSYRFRVNGPAGGTFVSGVHDGGDGAFVAPADTLAQAPWSAFGPLDVTTTRIGDARVDVAIVPGALKVSRAEVAAWVVSEAQAVAGWYGRFPTERVLVVVVPRGRRAVGYGTTLGNGGAGILVSVGTGATRADLDQDWVMAHELSHLGLANLPFRQRWMEEGLATYVEPLARARAGLLPPAEAMQGFVKGLPNGLPRSQDGGLDGTRSWGRIYWGGALFWLTADLALRDASKGRLGLADALRALIDDGHTIETSGDADTLLSRADALTGVPVLAPLYRQWSREPVQVDLASVEGRLRPLLEPPVTTRPTPGGAGTE